MSNEFEKRCKSITILAINSFICLTNKRFDHICVKISLINFSRVDKSVDIVMVG